MHSTRDGRRGGALLSVALLASLGFGASAIAVESTQGSTAAPAPAKAPIVLAQAAPAKVTYSKEQATRGERRYVETCSDCHGEDLRGGLNGGAPIRGSVFLQHFGGSPASALFMFMSTQMPPESPGRFSDSVYIDLMAYVLQMNGFEPGAPLPSNPDDLDNLIVEK